MLRIGYGWGDRRSRSRLSSPPPGENSLRSSSPPSPPLASRAGGRVKRARRDASLNSIVKQPDAHARLRASARLQTHASSPLFFVRPGAAGLLCLPFPREGVRNAWAFHRTRGPVCKRGRKDAHELLTNAAPRLRSARDGFFGLLNAPRRRRYRRLRPVRANCRPDTHLDRSPVLPASVPSTPRGLTLGVEGPASWRPSHPAPRSKDGSNAPSHRSGTVRRIILRSGKINF